MGRSNAGPSLRTSAGARFTVTRLGESGRPRRLSAARTRSRDSCTAAPGSPTMVKLGSPPLTSTSTVTRTASTPTTVAEATVAYIAPSLGAPRQHRAWRLVLRRPPLMARRERLGGRRALGPLTAVAHAAARVVRTPSAAGQQADVPNGTAAGVARPAGRALR